MHYLDHACFSPPAAATQTAVREAVTDLTSVAERGATQLALDWLRQRERARTAVAHLLDVSPAEVALTESTTHGLGIIAGGLRLRLRPGDNVVVADCDFIGLPTVWRSQERSGVQLRAVRTLSSWLAHRRPVLRCPMHCRPLQPRWRGRDAARTLSVGAELKDLDQPERWMGLLTNA